MCETMRDKKLFLDSRKGAMTRGRERSQGGKMILLIKRT